MQNGSAAKWTKIWARTQRSMRDDPPELRQQVKWLVRFLAVHEQACNACYHYAWTLTDKTEHSDAIWSSEVLWNICIDRLGLMQPKLGKDRILTCHGLAYQDPALQDMREELLRRIDAGETPQVYRKVYSHSSRFSFAHYWSLTRPPEEDLIEAKRDSEYEQRLGLPVHSHGFVHLSTATLTSNAPFVLRHAPGIDVNAGGNIEVVAAWGAVIANKDNVNAAFLYRLFRSV